MSARKRKAEEQLAPISSAAIQPLPLSAALNMGSIQSMIIDGFRGGWRAVTEWLYVPTYRDQSNATSEAAMSPPLHITKPTKGVSRSVKRHRTRHHESVPRSSKRDEFREAGTGTMDLRNCATSDEASKRVDDFWRAEEFGLLRKRSMKFAPTQETRPQPIQDSATSSRQLRPGRSLEQLRTLHPHSSSYPPNELKFNVRSRALSGSRQWRPEYPRQETYRRQETKDDDLSITDSLGRLLAHDGHQNEFQGGDSTLPLSAFRKEIRRKAALERDRKEKEAALLAAKERRLRRRAPSRPLIQPMNKTWERRVDEVFYSRDQQVILATSLRGNELRLHDFAKLLGRGSWLNDEIINTYIEWVVEAANKAAIDEEKASGKTPGTVPKFIAHNSFFYQNLIKKGASSTANLMKRKKAPGNSLMEVDSVFVPINKGSHWTIGVVRPVAKTIEYFDSMGGSPQSFTNLMRDWLKFALGKAYIEEEWKVPKTTCAIQNNGYDCGVFVCTNAFCVALGLDTSCYLERDMMQQRRNIAAILLNRGFVGDFGWDMGDL
ncbi:hypothetical protein BJ875DRAFT_467501 [Amylocarpus encephaloides]|uniref:Ubiquitin-like protease family profile domain-containing protein n=1 Tax=Amylocarpus encephaloides TaxID=45428 RepID=A0A9P8C3L6_9HELO|nr:hypothetical protein BJ875DRAFT_467501 [Amylocarpus encephaloides]